MIDKEKFEALLPFALEWAKTQEKFVLEHGASLNPQLMADARLAGVKDCDRVRILVVDRIPVPELGELAEVARKTRILTEETRCTGFGHAIIVRADAWGDREILLHNLVHIAQCERVGGLEQWV